MYSCTLKSGEVINYTVYSILVHRPYGNFVNDNFTNIKRCRIDDIESGFPICASICVSELVNNPHYIDKLLINTLRVSSFDDDSIVEIIPKLKFADGAEICVQSLEHAQLFDDKNISINFNNFAGDNKMRDIDLQFMRNMMKKIKVKSLYTFDLEFIHAFTYEKLEFYVDYEYIFVDSMFNTKAVTLMVNAMANGTSDNQNYIKLMKNLKRYIIHIVNETKIEEIRIEYLLDEKLEIILTEDEIDQENYYLRKISLKDMAYDHNITPCISHLLYDLIERNQKLCDNRRFSHTKAIMPS
jgi:hypothetical protein